MEYSSRTVGNTFEGSLTGKMTFADQKEFRKLLEEMKNSSTEKWIMDLTRLDFIDSAGLGLLLRVKSTADTSNISFTLRVSDTGNVNKLMNVSKFEQLIPFEQS
jgi:anti-anti-sigma factor